MYSIWSLKNGCRGGLEPRPPGYEPDELPTALLRDIGLFLWRGDRTRTGTVSLPGILSPCVYLFHQHRRLTAIGLDIPYFSSRSTPKRKNIANVRANGGEGEFEWTTQVRLLTESRIVRSCRLVPARDRSRDYAHIIELTDLAAPGCKGDFSRCGNGRGSGRHVEGRWRWGVGGDVFERGRDGVKGRAGRGEMHTGAGGGLGKQGV